VGLREKTFSSLPTSDPWFGGVFHHAVVRKGGEGERKKKTLYFVPHSIVIGGQARKRPKKRREGEKKKALLDNRNIILINSNSSSTPIPKFKASSPSGRREPVEKEGEKNIPCISHPFIQEALLSLESQTFKSATPHTTMGKEGRGKREKRTA